jgi:hypothetical protein
MPDADVVCTYTNSRRARAVLLRKQWFNGVVGDQISVATTGPSVNPLIASTSTGNNLGTGVSVLVDIGAQLTLPAETFLKGTAANYTTSIGCTGVTPSGNQPGATFTMPDADVVCTYTNARAVATLTLRKTWITANVGNRATLSASGFANGAAAGFLSTANSANETDTGATVQVSAGESGTIGEGAIGGPAGTWLPPSLTCVGNANALVGSTLTVSPTDTAIVCTVTNQRLPSAPPPSPPELVPTMSEYGMMLMAALLALMGGLTLRRRERR